MNATNIEIRGLPRLIYVGDVPVEASHYGPMLLYRLFSNYPADKLLIFETDLARSSPARRLPNVDYRELRVPLSRLATSRFSKPYSAYVFLSAAHRASQMLREIGGFRPEAVVSTAHHYHWATAARLAEQLKVPLHLIIHDDVLQLAPLPRFLAARFESVFGHVYKRALNRFCISPYMEAEYSKKYGAEGTVLYPSRGRDCPEWSIPPKRDPNSRQLKVAFAGSINSGGMADLLRLLTEGLESNDKLVLFGPHSAQSLKHWQLTATNLEIGGFLAPIDLIQLLRDQIDVLFVPMSFDVEGHADNMRLSFPSKIADYTATGLPLLICGPDYSSAICWARENEPVAEIVTEQSKESVIAALGRLRSTDRREMLGQRALDVGRKLFSHAVAESIFFGALSNSRVAVD